MTAIGHALQFQKGNKREKKMTANLQSKDHIGEAVLYMAMESSGTEWRLDFSSGARIESRRLWLELESLVRTNQSCQGATTLTVRLLQRYVNGERKSVSVLRVPTPDEEDQRCLNRERKRLIKEGGAHVVRIKSLLHLTSAHNSRSSLQMDQVLRGANFAC